MMEPTLKRRLDEIAGRFRSLRFWAALAGAWAALAAIGALLLGVNQAAGWYFPYLFPGMLLGASAALLLCGGLALRSARDYRWTARQVEAAYPELHQCLLTAVQQQPRLPNGRFGYLQQSVIRQALRHGYKQPWRRVVPTWRLRAAQTANLVALAGLAVVLGGLASDYAPRESRGNVSPADRLAAVGGKLKVTIEPGDAEVERGTGLLVIARFDGPLPPDAALVYQTSGGEVHRLAMSKSLDDPVFGRRIASVDEPLAYHVEFGDQQTDRYHVTVFDYPKLDRADAKLVFPQYTSLHDRIVQDVRRISAVVGTRLTLTCYLNKTVAQARLVDSRGEPIELAACGGGSAVYCAELTLDRSRRLTLQLVDAQGRRNKQPPEFVIRVLPNRPPSLKLVQPSRDVQVSPLEELDLIAKVWDDFGLNRFGLTYMLAGKAPQEVVLGRSAAGNHRVDVQHAIAFEELQAQPDELLSYYFWAEDFGPQGHVRRTSSAIYFAEVRPFEEIFRQGQQPPGGSSQPPRRGGSAQQAQQLADLEKQIISGTWNLIRRQSSDGPPPELARDVQTLLDAQWSALQQAVVLAEKVRDDPSRIHVGEVQKQMRQAVQHLTAAKDGPAVDPLQPALAAEQAAYQALLKLRARQHQVIRANARQWGGASGSRSGRARRQLQQLQLRPSENRYEAQRTASPPQEQQDRENRQVLNRLRELARRQNDLNKRIKALQSALQAAQSDAQREEIRRQLKRLRQEQQQILRDTDELRERMGRPENQEAMSEARQQLDRTRENVRQSSEALQQGRVSRAAASGTRAEREFRQLRDEFRRRASGRFNEAMRQMRAEAQRLDEDQQSLSRRLAGLDAPSRRSKSLRDTGQREQIQQALEQQEGKLDTLLQRMKQTVQEAEQAEPLLADRLYDAFRSARQRGVQERLEATRRSLERGLLDDARSQERVAKQGIGELRKGVERAAESVLGDQIEALRRARNHLKWLAEKLDDELARADPKNPSAARPERRPANRQGSRRDNPQQPGRSTPREGRRGDARQREQPGNENRPKQPAGPPDTDAEALQPDPRQAGRSGNRGRARAPDRVARGLERLLSDRAAAFAPIGGADFLEWSDRLRDVEEMLDLPELRAEAARIRDRARAIRIDSRRHSRPPNWDLVRLKVARPLNELRDRVAEELLRRTAKDTLVPIDRDPVPPQYAEQVRRYYERLGAGR